MKAHDRNVRRAAIAAVALTLLVPTACGSDGTGSPATSGSSGSSSSSVPDTGGASSTVPTTTGPDGLQPGEAEELLHLTEEEKLAHDLYVAFFDQWALPAWDQIVQAETAHLDAMRPLLAAHGLADPTAGHGLGEFADTDLQAKYDTLLAAGSASLVEALLSSALVEETDIDGLIAAIGITTLGDIENVCTNLREGAENHLRAFVDHLAARDVTYAPAVLDQATYDAIIAADTSTTQPSDGSGSTQGGNQP